MLPLTKDALLEFGIAFIFYFTIGSFGAFLKDLYETMTQKNEKIRLGEIIIGGACSTFICLGLQDTWFKDFSLNLLVLITFILGILGFEVFGNLTTLTKLEKFFDRVMQFKERFTITYQPPPEDAPPQQEEATSADDTDNANTPTERTNPANMKAKPPDNDKKINPSAEE